MGLSDIRIRPTWNNNSIAHSKQGPPPPPPVPPGATPSMGRIVPSRGVNGISYARLAPAVPGGPKGHTHDCAYHKERCVIFSPGSTN